MAGPEETDIVLKSKESAAAISEIVDAAHAVIAQRANPGHRPDRLYHFTNVPGLVGMLRSRDIWASLAVSLNDPSEVVHSVIVAQRILETGAIGSEEFSARIRTFLRPKNWMPQFALETHSFVISFCARADSALHWLHYGRQGSGCAIALDPYAVVRPPFDLVPVLYDHHEQERFLRSLFEAVFERLKHHIGRIVPAERESLATAAAHLAAQYVWASGSQLKNPVFEQEEEWRLITLDIRGPGVDQDAGVRLPVQFRSASGRVVPYLCHHVDPLPVHEILIGWSVPMCDTDPALNLLWREHLGGVPRILRSLVPVRP